MLEDYLEEPASEDVVLANEENGAQEEDSVIEDSPESFWYFEIFKSKKRKRNIVRKRPFRPRSCKKKEDFPFATRVVSEPVRLEFDASIGHFMWKHTLTLHLFETVQSQLALPVLSISCNQSSP